MRLWVDVETRGDRFSRGVAVYAKTVEVIVAQWAVDDGPVTVTDLTFRGLGATTALMEAAWRADEIWAHGAEFDRAMLATTPWFPKVPLDKWRCTMALARMHGLPGSLDKLCEIFKIPVDQAKHKDGKRLIDIFCHPKKDGTYNDRRSHPKDWAAFLSYGGGDIMAMRAVYKATPKWNSTPRMWAFWHLDQRMNERGIAMDVELAKGAIRATQEAKDLMADRTAELTDGAVERTTQRDRLLAYLGEYGVVLPDMTVSTVERRLEDEALPEHIKELLRVRQQASKASTAKYKRVLDRTVAGRLHNLLVFCGAQRTGRSAGRVFNPLNLPRPKHSQKEIELAIALFKSGGASLYDPDDIMGLASSALRGLIIADKGCKLVTSDLANIEGRYMAWIAGEAWKIKAFEDFDKGVGCDLYKISYARAFNCRAEDIGDDDWRRQIGKVMELALQYYGGVGAFCAMAETYGLHLDALAEAAWPTLPSAIKSEATSAWHKAVRRNRAYGLEMRVWVTCHSLVLMWRAAHPAIVCFWAALDSACQQALRTPDRGFKAGRVTVDRVGNWLRVRLPSGRYLNYPAPKSDGYTSSFLGIDAYTKQWKRISTYSGKRAENVCQGGAADVLMDGLLAADEAGYNPVLSVYDEAVTEPPDEPLFDDKDLSRLLVTSSPWAEGLPLAAKGFTDYRYRKAK